MYKALDKATDSLVAIKVIPLTEQDKEDFASIQKEIAFLSDCNHPNIVKYLVRACCESCVHGASTAQCTREGLYTEVIPCRALSPLPLA